jgi:hypothetical protein
MLRKHLTNLIEAIIERETSESLQRTEPEQKLKQERTLENCESSLVISWLGMGVARVLILNASEPMVGWKDEHPQSVSWQQPVIDKYFPTPCN